MRIFSAILLLAIMFFSCDDSVDIHKEENSPPVFNVKKVGSSGQFSEAITDSFRLASGSYDLRFNLEDEVEIKHIDFSYSFISGSGTIEIIDDSTLSVVPEMEGLNIANITMSDVYELNDMVSLSLFCFYNLPPVAKLTISDKGRYYLFDASTSYDTDRNFGGQVIQHELMINGNQPIYFEDPTLEFQGLSFSDPAIVRFRVLDNNNTWSEQITEIIYP